MQGSGGGEEEEVRSRGGGQCEERWRRRGRGGEEGEERIWWREGEEEERRRRGGGEEKEMRRGKRSRRKGGESGRRRGGGKEPSEGVVARHGAHEDGDGRLDGGVPHQPQVRLVRRRREGERSRELRGEKERRRGNYRVICQSRPPISPQPFMKSCFTDRGVDFS